MVVGLGNPGCDYATTRHNAGFWFVDLWAARLGLSFRKAWLRPFFFAEHHRAGDRLVLVRSRRFINQSGALLRPVLRRFRVQPADLLFVFDHMDLAPGRVRLKPHGSSGGHNGLRSIERALGGGGYARLAVGIGRPTGTVTPVQHVLGSPDAAERSQIDAGLREAVERADAAWPRGWEVLIHELNQRGPRPH